MLNLETSKKSNFREKGAIITLVLVFGVIFLILLSSLLGFILFQLRTSVKGVAWNESLHLAEAGIDYYKWCLNNEAEGNCLLNKSYYDPAGNLMGEFSLDIDTTLSCGETIQRNIISSGWTEDFPDIKRKVAVSYGRDSVARFAYLLNDNVWAGPDREIRGVYHSNGGIRMDGENQSLVSSNRETWVCTSSFGCSSCPSDCNLEAGNCICPGVFTTTNNAQTDLFNYPVPSFDFEGITIDLAQIKVAAQDYDAYFPPVKDIDSDGDGYHLVFKNDGTFEVRIITDLSASWAYNYEQGWHWDYFNISDEYFYDTYSINPSCSAIFFEDNLWVEGVVEGKITVASANLVDANVDTNLILLGDIEYSLGGSSDGLVLIGEDNILISPSSPDNMELKGIFIAQKGHFGRNHYSGNIKDKLEITGSIVSNGRVGTQWISGSVTISGYKKRENYIDRNLIYNPPPFVPYTTFEFGVVRWEELE